LTEPVWLPTAVVPPTPLVPPVPVTGEWLDVEVEGEGEHVLLTPSSPTEAIGLKWFWIGNLGDGEVRVGFRSEKSGQVLFNKTVAYLDGYGLNLPDWKWLQPGEALILRVVGDKARLSLSLFIARRSV